MKTTFSKAIALTCLTVFSSCCTVERKVLEAKSKQINNYERVSVALAKENRELIAEVNRLKFDMEKIKQENIYLKGQTGGHGEAQGDSHGNSHGEVASHDAGHGEATNHGGGHGDTHGSAHESAPSRSVASIGSMDIKKDLVEYEVYKWKAEDMHKIAESEFKKKNYEKAAQFYYSILKNYPKYNKFNDDFYFKAGVAAFETGEHHEWALVNFDYLMAQYPTSKYYRSAKLWSSLTHLKMGDKKKFFITVEEFRKKYRNSPEWKILSSYYEKIEEKTNE